MKLNEISEFYHVLKFWKQKSPERGRLYLDEDYYNSTKDLIIKKIIKLSGIDINKEEWFWVKLLDK